MFLIQKKKTSRKELPPYHLSSIISYFLKDEAISGKLILIAVALALIAANSPWLDTYTAFWDTRLSIGLGEWKLSLNLKHWVNDGLMAFFFLVVGLELRRELTEGELRNHRSAILPFGAALGGMLVPALIYIALNATSPVLGGWAIPMATDIALAIGVLALLGKKIPPSIRVFLLTLAIVDDVLAVIIIALFYSAGINLVMLLLMAVIIAFLYAFRYARFMTMPVYIIMGLALWLVTYKSGIHASIAGAVLGLMAPGVPSPFTTSVADKAEKAIIPFTTLLVVPLFAFANTGLTLGKADLSADAGAGLAAGIIFGLVVGKVAGVFGATWLMVKLGLADLPNRVRWSHVAGVGLLAGIGFTVAIFVTELAFDNAQYIQIAKVSIFIASVVSAVAGFLILRSVHRRLRRQEN